MGLVALWHVGSSQIRDQTCVSCIGRWILHSPGKPPPIFFFGYNSVHSVVSDSLQPHGLQHVRLPCPSPCLLPCPSPCPTPIPEPTQTHVHRVGDAIQPFHPLSFPSLPTFNLSQHQGLFKWVSSSHQVAKVLEFQLQHQSFQKYYTKGHSGICFLTRDETCIPCRGSIESWSLDSWGSPRAHYIHY